MFLPTKSKSRPRKNRRQDFFALNTGLYYSLLPIFAVALIEKFGQRRVFHDMNHVDEILRELILRQLVALDPEYSALGGIFELAAEAVGAEKQHYVARAVVADKIVDSAYRRAEDIKSRLLFNLAAHGVGECLARLNMTAGEGYAGQSLFTLSCTSIFVPSQIMHITVALSFGVSHCVAPHFSLVFDESVFYGHTA